MSLEGVSVLPIKRGCGRTQLQTVHTQPSNHPSLRHTNSLPVFMETVYADPSSAEHL